MPLKIQLLRPRRERWKRQKSAKRALVTLRILRTKWMRYRNLNRDHHKMSLSKIEKERISCSILKRKKTSLATQGKLY
ncbi:hypothetical protein ScPMuIL_006315 [Solemya velum]